MFVPLDAVLPPLRRGFRAADFSRGAAREDAAGPYGERPAAALAAAVEEGAADGARHRLVWRRATVTRRRDDDA